MNQQNPNHNPFQPPHGFHGHGHHPGAPDAGKGKGIASMVCGIVSIAFAAPFFGLAAAIAGLILAQAAAREGYVGPMRTAGLVCSIIGAVIGAMAVVGILGVIACLPLMFWF